MGKYSKETVVGLQIWVSMVGFGIGTLLGRFLYGDWALPNWSLAEYLVFGGAIVIAGWGPALLLIYGMACSILGEEGFRGKWREW